MEPHGENELIFQINDEVFSLDTDCMEMSDIKSCKGKNVLYNLYKYKVNNYLFLEDNKYAAEYIINLINNGSINIQDPLEIIYQILNDDKIVIYEADKNKSGTSGKLQDYQIFK